MGMTQEVSDEDTYRRSSQSRLLCFVVTAIAKLATYHRELLPRARVSLGKVFFGVTGQSIRGHRCNYLSNIGFSFQVARSRISDPRVWRRACDFLGLMKDPAICASILGPSRPAQGTTQKVGSINWSEGSTKMIAHIPFYILGEQEGEFAPDVTHSSALPAHFCIQDYIRRI